METDHPQTILTFEVEVDEGIANLIKSCWESGITTQFSCQEFSDGLANIVFPTLSDGSVFGVVLSKLGIPFVSEVRDLRFGAGVTIQFEPKFINLIAWELEKLYCVWDNDDLQQANEKVIDDYVKRSKDDETGWKVVKTFESSQIPHDQLGLL